jgi:hypothetical protein
MEFVMHRLPRDDVDRLLRDEYNRLSMAALKARTENVVAAQAKVEEFKLSGAPAKTVAIFEADLALEKLGVQLYLNRAAAVDDMLFRRKLARAVKKFESGSK